MNRETLIAQIKAKKSMLCVGLDSDIHKIPKHLRAFEDPVFEFNKQIIDATHPFAVAYKPNIAFYESQGIAGWESLQKTIAYIPKTCFIIADAKRGDIGNTAEQYANTFFNTFPCDAVTVAPYMGEDSVKPFLNEQGKWAIVLGLTSNQGAEDFQKLQFEGKALYEHVLLKTSEWGTIENLMFVVGATQPESLKHIRTLLPHHFFLVPGVGAQGGSLHEVCKAGMNQDFGLLINASRAIIFASSAADFAEVAAKEAQKIQQAMELYF